MAPKAQPPLAERISELRSEIDALIDSHVAAIGKDCPGVPSGVIRMTLLGHNAGCLCSAALAIQKARPNEVG